MYFLFHFQSGGSSNILLQLDTETKYDKDGDIQINVVNQEEALGKHWYCYIGTVKPRMNTKPVEIEFIEVMSLV